jgi:hypothetical protein
LNLQMPARQEVAPAGVAPAPYDAASGPAAASVPGRGRR